jgi:hypothetical protein
MKKILLICGILASVLYIGTDTFLAMSWEEYSYNSQTISELSAIGAQTRMSWLLVMIFLFNPLLIAFGIGVWQSAGEKRSLKITGILLSIWGALGYVWLFFPMHMRGEIGSTTDTAHLVMAGITVPLMMLFIGFGSGARGRGFRLYSILSILIMMAFGAWTGTQAPQVEAQLPTPWLGVIERISVYSPMLWILVLATLSLRSEKKPALPNDEII